MQFNNNFNSSETHNNYIIDFPNPIPNWISSNVIVEDLVSNSKHISEYIGDSNKNRRSTLATAVAHAFLKMLFLDNFFHSDLHPGNILVSPTESNSKDEYKVTFLDAGLAFSLEPNDLKNLKDLFLAVVLDDGETVGN